MKARVHADAERDVGTALLLTIGFMLMVGAIAAGLTAAVTTSVTHRQTIEQLRDREYAADAAVESAVATARGWNCSTTTGTLPATSMNGVAIRVDYSSSCSTSVKTSAGVDYTQRNVIFAACVDSGQACAADATIVRAQVNFEPANGSVTTTFVQSWSVNR
jgi:hypothetical protein